MPTFCRHNRFIEHCRICSRTLPSQAAPAGRPPRAAGARVHGGANRPSGARSRGPGLRVHREDRAVSDGFSSELVPGVHASADARRLAAEIAFASARLALLAASPPGLYGRARELAGEDLELASWACFLIAYLSPLEAEDPFEAIRRVLEDAPDAHAGGRLPDLEGVELGPHSSHDRARGSETLLAYRQWVLRAGSGGQAAALTGDPGWGAERRFQRIFERLALPGLGRSGRYELLVTLGRLGLYELRADSLELNGARGLSAGDPTTLAAKRLFAIGDPLLLERRAAALAAAIGVPVEALDLALANWASPERVKRGVPAAQPDETVLALAGDALGL